MLATSRITAVTFVLLLSACSSEDRSAPTEATDDAISGAETAGVEESTAPGTPLLLLGDEPRVQLRIAEHGRTTIDVTVVSRSEGKVGDELIEDTQFATYRLHIDLMPSDTDRLLARMSASDITMTPSFGNDDPGIWEWTLAEDGTLVSASAPSLSAGDRLAEMLSTYGLFLMVPSVPVGDQSGWEYQAPGSTSPIRIGIHRISENDIEAEMNSRHDTARGSVSLRAFGHWDRRTLLPTQAESYIQMSIESTTTRNGEVVPVSMSRIVHFQYEGGE